MGQPLTYQEGVLGLLGKFPLPLEFNADTYKSFLHDDILSRGLPAEIVQPNEIFNDHVINFLESLETTTK
jgi:hypothetical protein